MSRKKWLQGALALAAIIGWVGCGDKPVKQGAPKPAAGETEHHEGDGHDDHGKGEHAEHGHAEEGPHHGHLIELGQEEYHAEMTHDEATKTITIYLLDGSAKKAVSIADPEITLNLVVAGAPRQAKLAAAPQEGDAPGESSRFSITDEELLEELEAPKTAGRLNVTIAGKTYTGEIEHHEHGEHKHE